MYKKTMREALKEARAYRDPIDEGITGNIQKAITIAKKMGGNMTGAVKEIEKIARGLSDDPSVRAALKTANEELEEELISERRYMVTDYFFSDRGQVGLSVVVDAANENQAEKKALDKIEKLRDSPLARRKGVDDPTDMGMDVEITNKPLNYTDIEKDIRP
jgi:hypothetical protein